MTLHARRVAVALAGYCAFINLYAPQAILPLLAQDFGVGATQISMTMTACTLAVALFAPFSGAAADVLGRKRVIVAAMAAVAFPAVMIAFAPDVPSMVFWRFVQGLMLPPIFAVTIAYVGDEWPPGEIASATGIYVSGASLGGFSGRFVIGTLADLVGWRNAFLVLALLALTLALAVAVMLPRERHFVRSESLGASLRQMLRHVHNPQLVATCAVGFGTLFNFMATFTYVTFVLAAPPYQLSATALGMTFAVYLAGVVIVPMVGWPLARWGRRRLILGVIVLWAVGFLLTLLPSLVAIVAGLIFCAACGLVCQTISTSYVSTIAHEGRSSAVGLYALLFYAGGATGAYLPGLGFEVWGWPACVAMTLGMLVAMATIVTLGWKGSPAR